MEFLASAWMIAIALVVIGGSIMYSSREKQRQKAYTKYVNNITCECWTPEEVEGTAIKFILDNFRVNANVESIKYFSQRYIPGRIGIAPDSVIHIHAVSREKSDQCIDAHAPTDVRPDGKGGTTTGFVSHFNIVLDNANKELYLSPSKQ